MIFLTQSDQRFLIKRRKLVAAAKWVALFGVIAIAAAFGWQFVSAPTLANPAYVFNAIEHNLLEPSTVYTMALLTPILNAVVWFLLLLLVAAVFFLSRLEDRYQAIIRKLLPKTGES
ncbi:MAG: hypothetical protein AAF402_02830 [Pseudomonadota bacterium]